MGLSHYLLSVNHWQNYNNNWETICPSMDQKMEFDFLRLNKTNTDGAGEYPKIPLNAKHILKEWNNYFNYALVYSVYQYYFSV